MADQQFTVTDCGTNQQEAVGMGAAYDPRFESATVTASLPITDTVIGVEQIVGLLASMAIADVGAGAESIGMTASFLVLDIGAGNESILLTANVTVTDCGQGIDVIKPISANLNISDTGQGVDTPATAKAFFLIGQDGVLHPLGVVVLRDSRQVLLPGTRENTEAIPGRHGEIDFGSEFQPRVMELQVATSTDPDAREQLKRTLAKWLNPLMGAQPLIFSSDIEKTYYVKYAGKIDLTHYPNFLEFTIPFKSSDPFMVGSFERQHIGSGVLTNEGTFEAPVKIEIIGPVTNPSVTIGSSTLTWTGTVGVGNKLEIDTERMTVTFNGVNALANYEGGFPKLQPGGTEVTVSGGTITFTWRGRWI